MDYQLEHLYQLLCNIHSYQEAKILAKDTLHWLDLHSSESLAYTCFANIFLMKMRNIYPHRKDPLLDSLTLSLDNNYGEIRKERKGKEGEGKEGKRNEREVTLICLGGKGRGMRVFPSKCFNPFVAEAHHCWYFEHL